MSERFPLAAFCLPGAGVEMPDREPVRLAERRPGSIVEIALFADDAETETELARIVGNGEHLPNGTPLVTAPGHVVARLAPLRYLAIGQAPGLGKRIGDIVSPDKAAVVDLTHGRAGVRMSGGPAQSLLQKGLAFDLDVAAFPPPAATCGALHHMAVTVVRLDADTFDLYAMSSLAGSLWDWVTDAAVEYGWRATAPIE